MASPTQILQNALGHHQSGRLQEARELYCLLLQQDPRHADAWHLLGMVLYQANHPAKAVECIQRALAIQPRHAAFHANLGTVFRAMGRLSEAEKCYRQAIQLDSRQADYHSNLGVALMEVNRFAEAAKAFEHALHCQPHHLLALVNQGNLFRLQGKLEEAFRFYSQVLEVRPDHFEARSNLGNVLADQARLTEAEQAFLHALRLRPDSAETLVNLGSLYRRQQRLEDAKRVLQRALALKPEWPPALNNLGTVCRDLGELAEAEACYRRALQTNPRHAPSLQNLGESLAQQGRVTEALGYLRASLQEQPEVAETHSTYLQILNYDPDSTVEAITAEHVRWADHHGRAPGTPFKEHSRDPHKRLRIGYVSPDFRDHAVARFLEPLLAHHDARVVEVFAYAEVAFPDAVTERLQKRVHAWRPTCGLTTADLARQIRDDGIDILIDLAGHTLGNRLPVFAYRPAPVQATYLGYANTTGMTAIDYLITDAVLDPPELQRGFPEIPIRLEGGFSCFDLPNAPEIGPPPFLRKGNITLGSLHRLDKVNPLVCDLWSRVLHALPDTRLLMVRHTLRGAVRDRIEQHFLARGIAIERLEFRDRSGPGGHLNAFNDIDIALDTYPWSGGTVSCEALWMGVPTPTMIGPPRPSRLTATALTTLGRPEWIATTTDDYIERVVEIATNRTLLINLRQQLRQEARATLGDGTRCAQALEQAYQTIWQKWCADSA